MSEPMTDGVNVKRTWEPSFRGRLVTVPEGYGPLLEVLIEAFSRAASGKGAERHANGLPFADQPIRAIPRLFGDTAGNGPAFQVVKKLLEAQRLPPERARVERLDCIVYIASLCLAEPEP